MGLKANQVRLKTKQVDRKFARKLRGLARAYRRKLEEIVAPYYGVFAKQDSVANGPDPEDLADKFARLKAFYGSQLRKQAGEFAIAMAKELKKINDQASKIFGIPASAHPPNVQAYIEKSRMQIASYLEKSSFGYTDEVISIFRDPSNFGKSYQAIKEEVMERGDVSESKAEFIARDQTLKLNGEIVKSQQTNAGIKSYIWSTSGDERVREEHAALEGMEFEWGNPPSVGDPGEDFQCRCVAIPVLPDYLTEGLSDEDLMQATPGNAPDA